jgi:hypothetical protein
MMLPERINSDLVALPGLRLFGSRSMAIRPATDSFDPAAHIHSRIRAITDWDFSGQYSNTLIKALRAKGFEENDASHYFDNQTVAVFSKRYVTPIDWSNPVISEGDEKVHVVLHSDETLFRRVWDCIYPEFYYNYLWKRSPKYEYCDDIGQVNFNIKLIMNQLYEVAK